MFDRVRARKSTHGTKRGCVGDINITSNGTVRRVRAQLATSACPNAADASLSMMRKSGLRAKGTRSCGAKLSASESGGGRRGGVYTMCAGIDTDSVGKPDEPGEDGEEADETPPLPRLSPRVGRYAPMSAAYSVCVVARAVCIFCASCNRTDALFDVGAEYVFAR